VVRSPLIGIHYSANVSQTICLASVYAMARPTYPGNSDALAKNAYADLQQPCLESTQINVSKCTAEIGSKVFLTDVCSRRRVIGEPSRTPWMLGEAVPLNLMGGKMSEHVQHLENVQHMDYSSSTCTRESFPQLPGTRTTAAGTFSWVGEEHNELS
jgi:hypothetical protein